MLSALWHAFTMAFLMGWEIFWALALGFILSAGVQAFLRKGKMSQLLPDSSPRSLLVACGLGTASSSCSYAAVALTRSIIRKGADFAAAMAFQLASTNLVIELGIIIVLLLGWQFMLAEFMGGILMIYLVALFFRQFVSDELIAIAKKQADQGIVGKMEGHAKMDMSVIEGPILKRLFSDKGLTAISHYYVMDWFAIWKDIVIGLFIAGILAAWVPHQFWILFFLQKYPTIGLFWGPLVGPLIAIFSFVCSVGNIPLAAVLWNGGISFGGVIAFIFADLLVIPILDIYRKYYGFRMMRVIFIIYYIAMSVSALMVELVFRYFNLIPTHRSAIIIQETIYFNYTTFLNIIFLSISVLLFYKFIKTKGLEMLKKMSEG